MEQRALNQRPTYTSTSAKLNIPLIKLENLRLFGIVFCLFLLSSCANKYDNEIPRKITLGSNVYEESEVRDYLKDILTITKTTYEKPDYETNLKDQLHLWDDEVRYVVFTTSDIKRDLVQDYVEDLLEILSKESEIKFIKAKNWDETDIMIGAGSSFTTMKQIPLFRSFVLNPDSEEDAYDEYWQNLEDSSTDSRIWQGLGTNTNEISVEGKKRGRLLYSAGLTRIPHDKLSDYEFINRRVAFTVFASMFFGSHTSKIIKESIATKTNTKDFPYIWDFDLAVLRHMYAIPQKDDKTIEEVIEILVDKLMTEYEAEKI